MNAGVVRSHGSVFLSVKNVWTSICRFSRTNGLHTCHWRDRQVVVTVGVLGSTVFPPVVWIRSFTKSLHLRSRDSFIVSPKWKRFAFYRLTGNSGGMVNVRAVC